MMGFYLTKLFRVDAAEICNALFAATMNVHFAAKFNSYSRFSTSKRDIEGKI